MFILVWMESRSQERHHWTYFFRVTSIRGLCIPEMKSGRIVEVAEVITHSTRSLDFGEHTSQSLLILYILQSLSACWELSRPCQQINRCKEHQCGWVGIHLFPTCCDLWSGNAGSLCLSSLAPSIWSFCNALGSLDRDEKEFRMQLVVAQFLACDLDLSIVSTCDHQSHYPL